MKATISLEGLLALIHAKPAHISAGKFYGVWKDEDYPELSADELAKEIKASRKFREDVMTF